MLGAAATDRPRDRRRRLRLVVAEALGVRAHLLLGPGSEYAGVDIAGAARAPIFRTTSSSRSGRFTCSSSGRPSTSPGVGACGPIGAAIGSPSSSRRCGRRLRSRSTASPEPTTASSTGNPPPRQSAGCVGPVAAVHIHRDRADTHRLGADDLAVGADAATRQATSAARLSMPGLSSGHGDRRARIGRRTRARYRRRNAR